MQQLSDRAALTGFICSQIRAHEACRKSDLMPPNRLSDARAGYNGPMSPTLSMPLQAADTIVML